MCRPPACGRVGRKVRGGFKTAIVVSLLSLSISDHERPTIPIENVFVCLLEYAFKAGSMAFAAVQENVREVVEDQGTGNKCIRCGRCTACDDDLLLYPTRLRSWESL